MNCFSELKIVYYNVIFVYCDLQLCNIKNS